jgi:outer membrane biosynthesis protein TonB
MSHRNGVCSSCGAQYKVPADFASDKAKCKECGGVVEIGAIVEDPPPPPVPAKPVRKAAPKMEEHVPSGKKQGEPTMMERLKAERRAKSAKLKAAPEKKAVTAKPTAAKAATSKTATSKAATPKARATKAAKGDADEKKPSTRAASRRGAGSGSRRSGSKGSSRRRGQEVEEEEGEEKVGRRGRAKKKSPVPLIATLGLLIIGGGAAAYFMFTGGDDGGENTELAGNDQGAETPVEEPTEATPAEEPKEEEQAATDEVPAEEPPAEAEADAPKEDKPKPVSNNKEKDPTEIDLGALADFSATAGCSADQWASLQEDAALMIDPLAGAAGGRAEKPSRKQASLLSPQSSTP